MLGFAKKPTYFLNIPFISYCLIVSYCCLCFFLKEDMYFFYYNPNNNPNDITFLLNSRLFLPLLQSHDVPSHCNTDEKHEDESLRMEN